jgi:hypothetical protein
MAVITITTADASGLDADYAQVQSLEIEDTPLGSGGFGTVYPCRSVNGSVPVPALVVKVFHDGGGSGMAQNFATVGALQDRVRDANEGRRLRGETPLQDIAALKGLPLFRFQGQLSGKRVCGYAAYRLDTQGYVAFDTLTDGGDPDARSDYLALPLDERLRMATDLAEAFAILGDELDYLHADLNAPNLWVNTAVGRLAVIDFDSGTVLSGGNPQATTFGKLGEWLAPEATEQLALGGPNAPVPVTRQTDAWAVMVGIGYLLFLCHPLVYLERLGTDALRVYFATYQWPDIQTTDPNFNRDNAPLYDWYRAQVGHLPDPVREAFAVTLQEGSSDPARRTTPAQWREALLGQASQPVVHLFEADAATVPAGTAVMLRWWVEGAVDVTVTPTVGRCAPTHSRLVFPAIDTTYTLTARGLFGSVTATCVVRVVPQPPLPIIHLPTVAPPAGSATPLPLRLHVPALRTGLHINLTSPASSGLNSPVRRTRRLTLIMPAFPWRALFRRLNAMTLHVR